MAYTERDVNTVHYLYDSETIHPDTLYEIKAGHIHDLLAEATKSAIEGVYGFGLDVPVGAATSQDGQFIAADYAKDNLLANPHAHAEYMALQKTIELDPEAKPDTIGVTLEPCRSCQEYLSNTSSIKLVAFALPIAEASMRRIIRKKTDTILERHEQGALPFNVLQVEDPQLQRIGRLLLDLTSRDINTGETSIDLLGLDRALPREYRP